MTCASKDALVKLFNLMKALHSPKHVLQQKWGDHMPGDVKLGEVGGAVEKRLDNCLLWVVDEHLHAEECKDHSGLVQSSCEVLMYSDTPA